MGFDDGETVIHTPESAVWGYLGSRHFETEWQLQTLGPLWTRCLCDESGPEPRIGVGEEVGRLALTAQREGTVHSRRSGAGNGGRLV